MDNDETFMTWRALKNVTGNSTPVLTDELASNEVDLSVTASSLPDVSFTGSGSVSIRVNFS